MRKAAAVKWYELQKISQAKAAELCGVTRLEFLKILSEYQVSIIQYDDFTLSQELNP
jgi:predicted HTH domain antitoxin